MKKFIKKPTKPSSLGCGISNGAPKAIGFDVFSQPMASACITRLGIKQDQHYPSACEFNSNSAFTVPLRCWICNCNNIRLMLNDYKQNIFATSVLHLIHIHIIQAKTKVN